MNSKILICALLLAFIAATLLGIYLLRAGNEPVAPWAVSLPLSDDPPVNPLGKMTSEPSEAPATAELEPEFEEEELDEEVEIRIHGIVRDGETGEAVTDALVYVDDAGERPHETRSGNSGEYELMVPIPLVLELDEESPWAALHCQADGFAIAIEQPSFDDGESLEVDFALFAGALVSGRVADAETGAGIPEIEVRAVEARATGLETMMQSGRTPFRVETDENGDYSLASLPSGTFQFNVSSGAGGYLSRSEDAVTLQVKQGLHYQNIDFALAKGAAVRGRVVSETNAPIVDAQVNVMPADMMQAAMGGMEELTSMGRLQATADESGEFEIVGLSYDFGYRLRAEAEEYAQGTSESFKVVEGAATPEIVIVLGRGSTVTGVAKYEDGAFAGNHDVMLMPDFTALMAGKIAEPRNEETDSSGRFTFDAVPEGKYTLMDGETMPNMMPFVKKENAVNFEVDGQSDLSGLELTLIRDDSPKGEDAVITGTVLGSSGSPVDDARITGKAANFMEGQQETRSEEDGAFTLSDLGKGPYTVIARSKIGSASIEGVVVGSEITIRLEDYGRIPGRVVDESGQAVSDAVVRLEKASDEAAMNFMAMAMGQGDTGASTGTDEAGEFLFDKIEAGEYKIDAKSATSGHGHAEGISVRSGQVASTVTIQLALGVSFAGDVSDATGKPIYGAMVSLTAEEQEGAYPFEQFLPDHMQTQENSVTTDFDGQFQLGNIEPSVYTVRARHEGFAESVIEGMDLAPGTDVEDFHIVMTEGGGLTGQPLIGGVPREGIMVQALGPNAADQAMTDEEGWFELSGLTPGTYTLQVIDMSAIMEGDLQGAANRMITVEVIDGEVTEVDFTPVEGAAPVRGAVSGDLGMFTTVTLRREGGLAPEEIDPLDMATQMEQLEYNAGNAIIGEDGTFEMEEVEPGSYILEVFTMDMDLSDPTSFSPEAIVEMDRTPQIRREVTVEPGKPLELGDLVVGQD